VSELEVCGEVLAFSSEKATLQEVLIQVENLQKISVKEQQKICQTFLIPKDFIVNIVSLFLLITLVLIAKAFSVDVLSLCLQVCVSYSVLRQNSLMRKLLEHQ